MCIVKLGFGYGWEFERFDVSYGPVTGAENVFRVLLSIRVQHELKVLRSGLSRHITIFWMAK